MQTEFLGLRTAIYKVPNIEKAKQWFMQLGLDFTFQDHQYIHSIYTKDPDGHTVELTTLVVDSESFYNT